jgi:putative membrane protein
MSSAAPVTERKGFHVPIWVAVVVGGLVVLVGALLVGRAIGRHDGRNDGPRFGDRVGRFGEGNGGGHPVFWILVAIVVIGLAITGVVLLVRRSSHSSSGVVGTAAGAPTSAEGVLAERFARGEIDEAEFRSRRDALRT